MCRFGLPVIVFAQFAGTSLWFAGNAVLAGQSGFDVGWLTASVQAGFIGGTLVFSLLALSDRWAPAKLFLLCALLGACTNAIIPSLLEQVWAVIILRAATGFFLAGIYPVGMKIAADLYPASLGKALGWLVGALVLGTAFPHLLKGQLTHWSPAALFRAVSVLASAGGLLLYLLVPSAARGHSTTPAFMGHFREIWNVRSFRKPALAYLGHMWELYTFWAYVPLLLHWHPASESFRSGVGLASFGVIGIGALGCVLGGYLALRHGCRRVAKVALVISGACCFLSPLALLLPVPLYVLFLLIWGAAVVADSPQLSALAAQHAPVHLKGTALTLLTCAGFALTVVSILVIQYLAARLAQPSLALLLLAPGPVAGVLALRRAGV